MDNRDIAEVLYGSEFRKWFKKWAPVAGWHEDPDYPGTPYDLRRAFEEGATPSIDPDLGTWALPKKYKREVEGFIGPIPDAPLGGLRTRKSILVDSDTRGDSFYTRMRMGIFRKGNKI